MQKYIPSMSLYAPFYLWQRQLPVFLCASINHSKHRLCLICVLYQLRRRSYHSPDRSLCPGYPLHIPSSHPRSPPLILLPRQEAPELTIGKPLRGGTGWRNEERENIRERLQRGESGDLERPDRGDGKEQETGREQEIDRGQGKQMKKTGLRARQTDRKGERANNYRPPSVFKASLLSQPSCD